MNDKKSAPIKHSSILNIFILSLLSILLLCSIGFITSCTTTGNENSSNGTDTTSPPDVYVAGYTVNASDVFVPAYWLNGTRTDLPVIDSSTGGNAISIFVSGSDVYVAGYTYNASCV